MTNPTIFASLFISASAALILASAATAAPLAGPLALRTTAGELEQVQYRYRYRYRYPRSAYRSYAYTYRGYGRRGCVSGDDSMTSAYPSWAVCPWSNGQ